MNTSLTKHSLGWFLHNAVSAEGSQLLLDSSQGISKLTVIENNNGLLDPLQQVRGHALILINHVLCVDGIVNHLKNMSPVFTNKDELAGLNRMCSGHVQLPL